MNRYEKKLKEHIEENNITCEHLIFEDSCHSVQEAARTAHADEDDFVKNICLIDSNGKLIVAIVKGEDKVNTAAIEKILNMRQIRKAKPLEILEKTGYPCGGVPSFGYQAIFLIDIKVMNREDVYSGGGTENSLIKISTKELQKANNGQVLEIRE